MRTRLMVMVATAAVLIAACGPEGSGPAPATSGSPATATTEPPAPARAEAVLYAYSYEPGMRHDYAFELEQNLEMSIEGEGGLFGQETPGTVNLTTSIAGSVGYDIAAGPQPETTQITVSGVFDRLETEGTVDGEPFEEGTGEVPDLIEVPDLTFVVDERGRLVSVEDEAVPGDFPLFGDPFSQLGDFTSGGLGTHFGPAFPDEPLAEGDEWSYRHDQELDGLDAAMSAETTYRVAGVEQVGARTVTLIDFTTNVSEVEIDLGEMFRALVDGLAGSEPADAEIPDMVFLITVAPTTVTGTVWFDQEAGLVTKISQDTATSITMLMDFSDGSNPMRSEVSMDLDMRLTAGLVEGSST